MAAAKWQQANGARKRENGWPKKVRNRQPSKCAKTSEKVQKKIGKVHRALQGGPPKGRQLYFTLPTAPDPLFKASKHPFLP